MFKLTPINEIPDAVLKAIELYSFESKPGRYGVTTLLQPVQLTTLKRRHPEAADETPDEQIWRLFGAAFHKVLEDGAEALAKEQGIDIKQYSEQYVKIELFDRIVGGVIDMHISGDSINDYKVTKAWSVIRQDTISDWTWQLNMYRYMMFKTTGIKIDNLRIIAFFRDWDKKLTRQYADSYPKKKLMVYQLDLIPLEEVELFMRGKVRALIAAETAPDTQLPPCTPEEMWEKETEYAVYKEKKVKGEWVPNKVATRVLANKEQAEGYIATSELKPSEQLHIVERPGRRVRCEGVFDGGDIYCPVAHICPQHQAYLLAKGKGNNAKETISSSGDVGSADLQGCDKATCQRCQVSGEGVQPEPKLCGACRAGGQGCKCGK